MATADKPVELADSVLEAVKNGQQKALDAVRKFVDAVDKSLPPAGVDSSQRQQVIDSALDMADKLVATQYDFLHSVVQAAGSALRSPGSGEG